MMTEPPIADLLSKVDCCYTLAVESSMRARELIGGCLPLIDTKDTNLHTVGIGSDRALVIIGTARN